MEGTSRYSERGERMPVVGSSSTDLRDPLEVPGARSANIDYEYSTWYGFLAPANMPGPVLEKLSRAIAPMNTTKLREYATLLRRWNAFELGRSRDAPAALDYLDQAQEIDAAADYIEMVQKRQQDPERG
jgi:hypothetical protein